MFAPRSKAISVMTAVVAALAFTSVAAEAGTSHHTSGGILRATTEFYPNHATYDEVMYVSDKDDEGWGVLGFWARGEYGGVCVNEAGNNTRALCDPNRNFAENKWFRHYTCSKDGPYPNNWVSKGCGAVVEDVT